MVYKITIPRTALRSYSIARVNSIIYLSDVIHGEDSEDGFPQLLFQEQSNIMGIISQCNLLDDLKNVKLEESLKLVTGYEEEYAARPLKSIHDAIFWEDKTDSFGDEYRIIVQIKDISTPLLSSTKPYET